MNNIKKLFSLLFLCSNSMFFSMQHTHIVVIPGQNGLGGQNLSDVLPHYTNVHHVETPLYLPDFGQNRCISYLEKTLQPVLQQAANKQISVILHASSQGTATALNYFAYAKEKSPIKTTKNKSKIQVHDNITKDCVNLQKIKALILESVLLTGSSAIEHTLQMGNVPGAYYYMPYLAKCLYPFYVPAGRQAISSCNHLPKDLPVIIMHAPQDPQLSFQDSQALYAHLTQNGYKNVYFISVADGYHVLLLRQNSLETKVLQAILHKHNLLTVKPEEEQELKKIDLTPYQPEAQPEWKQRFDSLKRKERNLYWIDWIVKTMLLAYASYYLFDHYTNTHAKL